MTDTIAGGKQFRRAVAGGEATGAGGSAAGGGSGRPHASGGEATACRERRPSGCAASGTGPERPSPGPRPSRRPPVGQRRFRVHRAWWVAAVAVLTIGAAGSFTTVPGLLVDPLHREFGWSRSTIGLAASVNMALYGLTAPFAAALMDRLGIRRVVTCALLVVAAGAAGTTVMTAPWQLVLAWGVLVGLGTGSLGLAFAATLAGRWFTARRGLVTGVLTAASGTGQLVFLPLLAWIVDRHDWRPAAVTPALAALAVAPLAWLLLRDRPADVGLAPYGEPRPAPTPAPGLAPGPGANRGPGEGSGGAARRALGVLRDAATTGPFWLLAGTFAICGASTNGIMWTHFTPAAHEHGMPPTTAASLLAAIGVVNVAGTIGSGWLTDRLDARRLLAVSYALRGLSLLFLPVLLTAAVGPPMIGFVVLFGLLDLATVPPTIALCRRLYGADGPVVFGWVNAAHQVGAALMAFGGGAARDASGAYDAMWIAAGALCAAAALMALLVRRP